MKYAYGTFTEEKSGPFSCGLIRARALCSDGKLRTINFDHRRESSGVADTFFSIPARVRVNGRSVSGYITMQTVSGMSTPTADDPEIVVFRAHTTGKSAGILPAFPDMSDVRPLVANLAK